MTNVSVNFKQDTFAAQTDEAFLILIEIDHEDIVDGPVRFVNNGIDVVSNGNTYSASNFKINLPTSEGGKLPEATVELDNVDRKIGLTVRQLQSPPSFIVRLVRASEPDDIEVEYDHLILKQATYDMLVVSGTIGVDDYYNQTYPKDIYNPANFPGMF